MSTNPSKSRIGVYAGSFSPFHIGHLDIVRQSQKVFDTIIVLRAINPDKKTSDSPLPEHFLRAMGVDVQTSESLVTDYVKNLESKEYDITLIRGLRSGADLAYEQNLVAFMRNMHPQIKVVFFLCDPKYQHVSSSALRGIRQFSEEEYKRYAVGG